MGGEGWRLGRIAGIEVRVDPSLIVIAAIIVYSRWVTFGNQGLFPGTSSGQALTLAVTMAIAFFLSIFIHELGHAVVARLRHIEVDGITLWMFGGATRTRVDSRGPVDEFLIAAIGPLTSFLLGVGLLALANTLDPGPTQAMVHDLGWINRTLAIFNVLPGFPLDGGRILRSIVWAATGNLSKATVVAARVGQVFGAALIVFGLVLGVTRQDLGMLWLALIGWILLQAATATVTNERQTRALTQTQARDVMRAPPATIPGDLPVEQARATYLRGRTGAFPVMDAGRVAGFVSDATLNGAAPDRPVREMATSADAVVVVGPTDPVRAVADRLQAAHASVALVVDHGTVVGVVGEPEVAALLRPPRHRRSAAAPGPGSGRAP
jgi:Zn-dependent protease/predicted transcriptional regulator